MMRILATSAAIFLAAAPIEAQQDEIKSVISSQIQSFMKDDFATAFTFAAPNIKEIFQTSDRFGQMVRQSYPMVHHPAEVVFQGLREEAGTMQQNVLIRDLQGQYFVARYSMIQVNGDWQISGVSIEQSPGVGA
ncbi:DUF4864 domain-containing protein [Roseobacter sp. N2S]|uniref:DUF4864 domain-containing protein n=1 Tax=Roseobacter sp. N2S TaxID=2663844 RepID=UPI002862C0DD|nr:DUF4864 domain-containing protein [Roseobacter sp. N2S]MDR6265961.1 hypothetical protein [Roseobacter sp. N2S]